MIIPVNCAEAILLDVIYVCLWNYSDLQINTESSLEQQILGKLEAGRSKISHLLCVELFKHAYTVNMETSAAQWIQYVQGQQEGGRKGKNIKLTLSVRSASVFILGEQNNVLSFLSQVWNSCLPGEIKYTVKDYLEVNEPSQHSWHYSKNSSGISSELTPTMAKKKKITARGLTAYLETFWHILNKMYLFCSGKGSMNIFCSCGNIHKNSVEVFVCRHWAWIKSKVNQATWFCRH